MATGIIRQDSRRFEDLFFAGMAVVVLVSVFVGFAKSYYLAGVFKAPLPNLLVHIHGAVFSSWILLFITQISLVSAGRVDLHRRLGLGGFGLACVMVILGVLVATGSVARHYKPGEEGAGVRAFYAVALADMLMFATLVYFAFRNRFNPVAHKRLILIATFSILDAAFDRWPIPLPWSDNRLTPVLFCYPLLLLLMGYDWWSTRKIQRVTIWAGAFLVIVQTGRHFIGPTAAWQILPRGCRFTGVLSTKAKSIGVLSFPVDKGSPSLPLFAFFGARSRYGMRFPSQALIAWVEGVW